MYIYLDKVNFYVQRNFTNRVNPSYNPDGIVRALTKFISVNQKNSDGQTDGLTDIQLVFRDRQKD